MESEDPHRGLKGFKFSPLQVLCPIKRVKVKRTHYRVLLFFGGVGFYFCHVYFHEVLIVGIPMDIHWAFITNTLFALDPTA